MNLINYAYINKKSLNYNIKLFKKSYSYKHYILDVSNNAFSHGMNLINFLNDEFDYLFTNNFQDVLKIRKYNHDIKIIYNGNINEDNVYDLILNNAILVIKSKEILDDILKLKIKDKFEIIFSIDKYGYNGIGSKIQLSDILEDIKKDVHIHILGVISEVTEKDYLDFKYIINPLKNLELVILNNEKDKNKIKMSNSILLNTSIFGINTNKRKLFAKEVFQLKPVLEIYSTIEKVCSEKKGNKNILIGIIPFGINHGLINTSTVIINEKLYKIRDIKNNYSLIDIDSSVKPNDKVQIIGHIPVHSVYELANLTLNLDIQYEDFMINN